MRIIIVEDEIKIREGMGKLIESLTDHIVLGEASDGEEGLDLVLRFKPDLVITDIRMPKMDGLEMIRRLYEQKIPVHAVILSGYSEFEYAKKAIQYGVDDYLLKPLAVDDVQDMLEKIEEKIKKEQLTKGSPEVHLRNLIFGEEQEEEKQYDILEKVCGLAEQAQYILFAGYIGSAPASYREQAEKALEELKEKYREIKWYAFYMENLQEFYILACAEWGFERISDLEKSFYNRLIFHWQDKEERPIWTRQAFQSLRDLKKTAQNLNDLISFSLIWNQKGWLTREDVNAYHPAPFLPPAEIYTRIRNAVCQGNPEKEKEGAEEFLRYMKDGHFDADDIRRAFVKNYYMIGDTLEDIDRALFEHLKSANLLRNIEAAVTWHELENAYRDVIQLITSTRVKREDISNYVIKKAINYIREHYQEGLTQEEVSRVLEITPEYLSTLFNREMGITFSSFLKQFRMSHAKRLLKGTDMKIYEIAKATGYNDPKNFQRVFKEETGVSPGEYMQMN